MILAMSSEEHLAVRDATPPSAADAFKPRNDGAADDLAVDSEVADALATRGEDNPKRSDRSPAATTLVFIPAMTMGEISQASLV